MFFKPIKPCIFFSRIFHIITALAIAFQSQLAFAQSFYQIDQSKHTIETPLMKVTYASHSPEGNPMVGIRSLFNKKYNEEYATLLDGYGCGYAKYCNKGPNEYSISASGDDFVELTLTFSDCVNIKKKERLYKHWPILEITYETLDLSWWEDFFSIPNPPLIYSIYGIPNDIDSNSHATFRKCAESKCGHNFGDCYIECVGKSVTDCTYKDHFIFGIHSMDSGRGLGFIFPVRIGLHDGWKLWSMHNYESFPFYGKQKQLPLKRWFFFFSGGRTGLMTLGKSIVDSGGAPPFSPSGDPNPPSDNGIQPSDLLDGGVADAFFPRDGSIHLQPDYSPRLGSDWAVSSFDQNISLPHPKRIGDRGCTFASQRPKLSSFFELLMLMLMLIFGFFRKFNRRRSYVLGSKQRREASRARLRRGPERSLHLVNVLRTVAKSPRYRG